MSNNESDEHGGGRSLGGGPAEALPADWARPNTVLRGGGVSSWNTNRSAGSSGRARIAGLHSLSSSNDVPEPRMPTGPGFGGDDSDDDDQSENQPQSFFAGGERSGISVEGPARGGGNRVVNEILKKAAQGGVAQAGQPQSSRNTAFSGGGHTLGSEDLPSSFIPDPTQLPEGEEREETAVRHIIFWREGFSVEDGPLLRYDIPENARLLHEINTGHAPPSILNVRAGQPVELRVARREGEDYQPPPKRPLTAFEGEGNRLGEPSVPIVRSDVALNQMDIPGAFPSSNTPAVLTGDASSTPRQFEVDLTAPMTSIQIRLADGTRLVARMNLTHTIGDIRNFIDASHPSQAGMSYIISTTFPNKVLADTSVTIDAAGIKNSVVVQRLS